ncbi:MAG: glucose-6-phosphate dehydrogenase assembly protein OpcA [Candidatus Solibacter sp.]|nr:glucose-6-phosphate dehydrogenase assembly protein OpcA [Candidatus Solibacter sp.]
MRATVAPDNILKELAALWTQQGQQGDAGVLRACSMTLLVIAEATDDAAALGETVAALMPEHPARTILIRLRGEGERALSERVYQQCWKPFGQRQQICCEQIEITASDAALADLPSVLLPLAVPDLPVILWCRSERLVRRPEFAEIARMATKAVIDSAAAADATESMRRMADAVRSGGIFADLAWTRLTRWRETLARVFENRDTLAHLSEVNRVLVRFGPGYDTAAWYLAAWAANALESVGQVVTPVVARQDESLRLELSGGTFRVELSRQEERLVTMVNEQSNCTNLPRPTDYHLMREELGIVRRDPVFEGTLASAARLAVSSSSGQS